MRSVLKRNSSSLRRSSNPKRSISAIKRNGSTFQRVMALSPSRKVVVGSKLNITPMKMRDSEDSDWVSE